MKAQHVIAADRIDRDAVARRVDMAHPRGHRGVVARPLEGRRANRPAGVHLHAISLVLQPAIAGGGRHLARVGVKGGVAGVGAQPAGGGRGGGLPAGDVFILGGAGGIADVGQHLHLPHGLQPAGGVHAHGGFDEAGVVDGADVALPHVHIHQRRAAGRQRRRVGVVGLGGVGQRRGAGQLGQTRVPGVGRAAVVFGEQAVHIDATRADAERPAAGLDAEAIRRDARHHVAIEGIQRAGLQAPPELGDPFVPLGIELDAALLHDQSEKVLAGVEADTAQIETHDVDSLKIRKRCRRAGRPAGIPRGGSVGWFRAGHRKGDGTRPFRSRRRRHGESRPAWRW